MTRKISPISVFIREGASIKRKHQILVIRAGSREQAKIAVLARLMKMQAGHGCHYKTELAAEDSRRYTFEMMARLSLR
jgi:hypothetical protein